MTQVPPTRPRPARLSWQAAAWLFAVVAGLVTAFHVARGCVNVPYWDDFDAYLQFLVRIDDAPTPGAQWRIAAEFHNEHRTLTSRAAVWAAHALGARMNFRVLGWAGAAMILPTLLLTLAGTGPGGARAAMALFAAAMLFNLQHWENLFWGGSSADHVTVVPLAMAALLLLQVRSPSALAGAITAGFLAAFTLAHGLLVFPLGLALLALQRRWRALIGWAAASAAVLAAWMFGFSSVAGDSYRDFGPGHLLLAGRFWLGLLGAPLAFGSRAAAPWIGLGLAAGLLFILIRGGAWRRHPYHAAVLAFALLALLAITAGRVGMEPAGWMVSRYRILSCLVIAIAAWLAFVESPHWGRFGPVARVALCVALPAHWLEQTIDHWGRSAAFCDRQLAAAAHYVETGTLAGAPTGLYYDIPKADAILARAAARGIFELAPVPDAPAATDPAP